LKNSQEATLLIQEIKSIMDETTEMVVEEELLADESFLIFLNLSEIVNRELVEAETNLLS